MKHSSESNTAGVDTPHHLVLSHTPKYFALLCIVAFLSSLAVANDAPHKISYQGMLTDNTGKPMANGNHVLKFTLYNDSTGTSTVWTSSNHLPTQNGVFNAILGDSGKGLPTPLMLPLWLGVSVDAEPELRPLTELVAAPYALGIADSTVSTSKLQDSSVTAAKMAQDFVGHVTLNNNQFSTHKGDDIDLAFGPHMDLRVVTTGNQVRAIIDAVRFDSLAADSSGGLTTIIDQSPHGPMYISISAQGVQSNMIKDHAVGNIKLADASVDSRAIADGSVTGVDVAVPLVLVRNTSGRVLSIDNTANNIGGVPGIEFKGTGGSSDGTPVLSVIGNVVAGPVISVVQSNALGAAIVVTSAGGGSGTAIIANGGSASGHALDVAAGDIKSSAAIASPSVRWADTYTILSADSIRGYTDISNSLAGAGSTIVLTPSGTSLNNLRIPLYAAGTFRVAWTATRIGDKIHYIIVNH